MDASAALTVLSGRAGLCMLRADETRCDDVLPHRAYRASAVAVSGGDVFVAETSEINPGYCGGNDTCPGYMGNVPEYKMDGKIWELRSIRDHWLGRVVARGLGEVDSIAVRGQRVYWMEGAALRMLALGTGSITTLTRDLTMASLRAVGPDAVYWAAGGGLFGLPRSSPRVVNVAKVATGGLRTCAVRGPWLWCLRTWDEDSGEMGAALLRLGTLAHRVEPVEKWRTTGENVIAAAADADGAALACLPRESRITLIAFPDLVVRSCRISHSIQSVAIVPRKVMAWSNDGCLVTVDR